MQPHLPEFRSNPPMEPPLRVRLRGLARLVFSLLGMCAVGLLIWFFAGERPSVRPNVMSMMLAAMPGCYALIGIAEIASGVPYSEMKRRWDRLPRPQYIAVSIVLMLVTIFTIIPFFVGIVLPLVRPYPSGG
ncbi:hypothetical protein [Roseimicrobium sp. ORNL1]|uniref:hypothetical protein n=1 Tax=Roseimicrobium sp. ORNL1 TaxID=2711231 RepID=UPI0013E1AF12|nr:hypothetical protein [Roseimicrobium sp. ORNL1]QIF00195.1 hypothetical protein G5S37_01205 [Roseimicrobium sp. ORNL1]